MSLLDLFSRMTAGPSHERASCSSLVPRLYTEQDTSSSSESIFPRKVRNTREDKLKFIDLFAGIGGFHLALHQLGCECVFASEIDKSARKTYQANFQSIAPELFENGMFNDDITKITPLDIPDFDILCAGFPCQPFSQMGYKRGFEDPRGNLFFRIVDILQEKRPRAYFLENVQGLLTNDDGRTFQLIRKLLEEDLNYSFYYKIVKAYEHGLPQNRKRVFIIGFRDDDRQEFSFPKPIPLKFTMSDLLGGVCTRDVESKGRVIGTVERQIGFTLRCGGAGSGFGKKQNWDSYRVDGKVVKIEPEHGLQMQGFPADFILPKKPSVAFEQLGNSVAVDAVRECAKALIDYLSILK